MSHTTDERVDGRWLLRDDWEWSGPERRERDQTHDHICVNVVTAKLAGVCSFCRRGFATGSSIIITKVNQHKDSYWLCFDCGAARMVQLLRAAFGDEA